jgi:hypothetical protein
MSIALFGISVAEWNFASACLSSFSMSVADGEMSEYGCFP